MIDGEQGVQPLGLRQKLEGAGGIAGVEGVLADAHGLDSVVLVAVHGGRGRSVARDSERPLLKLR